MKKFLVIEGQVHPEHYISDLGETIPYKQEVSVPYERAQWSRDLSHAIQQGSVTKKRVVTVREPEERLSKRSVSSTPRKAPQNRKAHRPKAPEPTPEKAPQSLEILERSAEENENLRQMNQQLVATTERLLERQDLLIEKLSEYIDRPVQVVSGTAPVRRSAVSDAVYEDDDIPTFVPSKIRSGKAKASEGSEVQSDSKAASKQLSDATDALKSLRKGKDND